MCVYECVCKIVCVLCIRNTSSSTDPCSPRCVFISACVTRIVNTASSAKLAVCFTVCVCLCVYLCCVFPPSRGFGLLTLQTPSLITVHNKSLRALRDEFISLRSALLFLSFPLSCSYFLVFYLFFFPIPRSLLFLPPRFTLNTLLFF